MKNMLHRKEGLPFSSVKIMKQRYFWIDNIRAIAMVSMIVFHAVWDLVYLYGMDWEWYGSDLAFLWQQSICWTFILLSGFCWSFSRNPLKQGLIVSAGGLIVTVVTLIFSYESRVIFGVLNLIGASALLLIPLSKYLDKIPTFTGSCLMFLMFGFTYGINDRHLGFFGLKLFELPLNLYKNLFTAFWGFPEIGFYSSDYFALLPWMFLYFAGYFLYGMWKEGQIPDAACLNQKIPVLTWMGKNSLLIYMIHQPVIYGIFKIIFWWLQQTRD